MILFLFLHIGLFFVVLVRFHKLTNFEKWIFQIESIAFFAFVIYKTLNFYQ